MYNCDYYIFHKMLYEFEEKLWKPTPTPSILFWLGIEFHVGKFCTLFLVVWMTT